MNGRYKVVDTSNSEVLFEGSFLECKNYIADNVEDDSELYYNVWIMDADKI